jgi:tetratricopeptide (TPR) repeat protein
MLVSVAEATLALLRGEAAKSVEILEELKSSGRLAAYPGRHSSLGTLAVAYNQLGQHEKAKMVCEELLGTLTEEDREFVVFSQKLEIQLALAEAAMGDTARAGQRIDRLIERYGTSRGPATLALLHQGRARVALLAGDAETCQQHAEAMGEFASLTKNPFLIAQSKRLARKSHDGALVADPETVLGHSVGGSTNDLEPITIDDDATDLFDGAEADPPVAPPQAPVPRQ